jgi:tetratricopeptide (TPR) repeat protein
LNGGVQPVAEIESGEAVVFENTNTPEISDFVKDFSPAANESFVKNNFVPTTAIYEQVESEKASPLEENAASFGFESLDDLRSELDLEENAGADVAGDYEMHYQTATAYKEMGLMENAIREFQDAINLVEVNDGTRRFFQCANMLGHCFLEKNMPKAAAVWFMRDLEVSDLTTEERLAVYYDIADAFEANGEPEKAIDYFERLYAENIDYRDVSERLEDLQKIISQIPA